MRRLPFGLMNSGAMKDKPINFTSLGIGSHSRALRRRVSRDVFTINQGLVTPDISTSIVSPAVLKVNEKNINNTENTFTASPLAFCSSPVNAKFSQIISSGSKIGTI